MKTVLPAISILLLTSAPGALASPINQWRGKQIRLDITESDPEVTWSMETSDSTLESLAIRAVAQWENVDSAYIAFRQVTPAEGGDIRIKILDSLSNSYAGGQALVSWDVEGIIQPPCSIELLAGALNQGDSDYRQMILAHEFGHCLGLAHSVVNGAVMSYRQPGPELTFDDRYALTLAYPSSDESLPLGCASLSTGSNGGKKTRKGRNSGPLEAAIWILCAWCGHHLTRKRLKPISIPGTP